ncbi:MAG: hypothetical protein AABX72_00965 [Nanoarchaeota archaeon]
MATFDIICRHVKLKNVHMDEKSKEAVTGKVKRKYKLAGNPIKDLDQFIFFVMTSDPNAYHRATSIQVDQTEWINRNTDFPKSLQGVSHIDLTRNEVLTAGEVGYKIVDEKNRFHKIAELPESKYREFKEGLVRLKKLRKPTAPEITRLLVRGLEPLSSDLARKLGV